MKTRIFLSLALAVSVLVSCKEKSKPKTDDPVPTATTFTDARDQKTYSYVTIGTQTWMSQNLDYAGTLSAGSSECYNGSADSCAKYGRLYDAAGAKVACPSGWHLPTDAEWKTLESYIGMSAADLNVVGFNVARGENLDDKLKEGGVTGLNLKFSGSKGTNGVFGGANSNGTYFTSSDSSVSSYTMVRRISDAHNWIIRYWNTNTGTYRACVRCLQD